MIAAAEALGLASAQLTETQKEKLAALDTIIEEATRATMGYRGITKTIKIEELDKDVLAAMDFRLKKKGWSPQWLGQVGKVNPNTVIHYFLNLDVMEAAREEHESKKAAATSQ